MNAQVVSRAERQAGKRGAQVACSLERAHVFAGTPVAGDGTLVGTVVVDGHVGVLATHVGDLEVKSSGVAQDVGRGEVGCLGGEGRRNRQHLDL